MANAKKADDSAAAADAIPQAATSKLRKLVVQNFGCIGQTPVEIELDSIVVLVGPNNVGKSTILRAYQAITQSASPKLPLEDFHERKVDPKNLPTVELYTAVVDDLPGNKWILVEGDTEYTAFKYIVANDAERDLFKDVHVVRARGKVTIGLLAKILNQFNARFAALHDSDTPTVKTRKGNVMKNPAWTNNDKILTGVGKGHDKKRVRLVASLTNFESAMFGEEVDEEKPYNAFETMKAGGAPYDKVKQLLIALLDFEKPLPNECHQWDDFAQFEAEFQKRFPSA